MSQHAKQLFATTKQQGGGRRSHRLRVVTHAHYATQHTRFRSRTCSERRTDKCSALTEHKRDAAAAAHAPYECRAVVVAAAAEGAEDAAAAATAATAATTAAATARGATEIEAEIEGRSRRRGPGPRRKQVKDDERKPASQSPSMY